MASDILKAFQSRFAPKHGNKNLFQTNNDVILFLHIPKTAGMSVGKALQDSFDQFHPILWENIGQSFRRCTRSALYQRSHTPCRQVLMGHFSWSELQYWRNQELPIQCATIIRDPLDRFVSNYNYNCSDKHPTNKEFQERFPTMEDYAHKLPHDYQLQTMIGAFFDFDHALELLTKYYSFIGVTEHLGDSLSYFQTSHGLNKTLQEHRENSGKPSTQADIPQRVRDIVAEKSVNDHKLHQLISSFYG